MTRLPTGFSYGLPVLFVLIMTAGLASMLGATPSAGHALVGASPTPTCGPAWNVVPSCREGTGNNGLYAVAAASSSDVWAVGYYTNTGYLYQTLVERWDGTQAVVPGARAKAPCGAWRW